MSRKMNAASQKLNDAGKSREKAPAPPAPSDNQMAEKHRRVWRAIDDVASSQGLSPSSLAKLAGLDATAFNPSKRVARDGRLRWPGVETLSKVSEATGVGMRDIFSMIDDAPFADRYLPLARLVVSDASGQTQIEDADAAQAAFRIEDAEAFFLDLADALPPAYRKGDRLVVSPAAPLSIGDRIVAANAAGAVTIGLLARADAETISITGFDADDATTLRRDDCAWIGRIVWASQ